MRWIAALLAVMAGTCLGLAYGWILNPVGVTDTSPASLRIDYRTDYVLMVAESYHSSRDLELAYRQLAVFAPHSPASLCADAVRQALTSSFAPEDVAVLEELLQAMQPSEAPPPTPAASP